MNKAQYVIVFSLLSATAFSQNVATINNKPVLAKEFFWVYKKNHDGNTSTTYEKLAGYLDLYINFRLKVMEAKALKMDKDTAYINEIKAYEEIVKANARPALKKEECQYLMNEYRDGVLMFNISEKMVWTPRRSDAAGAMTEAEQQQQEKEWIKELRDKYQIRVFPDELRKLVKP